MTVALIYILAALFLGWLAVMLYRTRVRLRSARAPGDGADGWGAADTDMERLAVVVRDLDNWAEWLVRCRIASAAGREPGMRVVLVDGGSTGDTPLILERLARRFNMGFCRAADVEELCRRGGRNGAGGINHRQEPAKPVEVCCPGPCFQAAGMCSDDTAEKCAGRPVRCVEYADCPAKRRPEPGL